MATLLQQGHRRCDARCYNAKHGKCRCICGGENHGKGLRQVIEQSDLNEDDFMEQSKLDLFSEETEK